MDFYVDDVLYETQTAAAATTCTWVYDSNPFFILLNLAVGGGYPGNPDATTTFPQSLLVDYVRVYQSGVAGTPTPAPAAPVTASTWRINSAGLENVDSGGATWSPDGSYPAGC